MTNIFVWTARDVVGLIILSILFLIFIASMVVIWWKEIKKKWSAKKKLKEKWKETPEGSMGNCPKCRSYHPKGSPCLPKRGA